MIYRIFKIALFTFFIYCNLAHAAIESSPHDIIAREGFQDEQLLSDGKTTCSYCHPALEDVGVRIWKTTPPSLKDIGEKNSRCYACHDGVAIVDINVDASQTAFAPDSHGMFKKKVEEGFYDKYIDLEYLQGKPFGCTTCHNIHNDDNRPFLAEPIEELCSKCHLGRKFSGFGENNTKSNHPVSVPPVDNAGGVSPIEPESIFKTAFPLEYPDSNGKESEGTHWDSGGHLSVGNVGNIECFTCHSVHGDERKGPNRRLLTVDPVKEINDMFCEGCHKGERGDGVESTTVFPNPGGTTGARTYHPVDDDISNGEGDSVETHRPSHWPFGSGEDENIICTTCHDPHYAMPNTPILRAPVADTFCEECHDESPQGHHQSGEDSNENEIVFATTGYSWTYDNEFKWENGNPVIKLELEDSSVASISGIAKVNGYGKTYGYKVENKIYCSSCHRAHNAGAGIEEAATPLLIVSHTANQLCFMCHSPENVAFTEDENMRASHFLGDPFREDTYKYNDESKLHQYKGVWKETGLKSKYGGDNEREVVCQSCHSFDPKNLNASEYTNVLNDTAMLIARADKDTEWILGTGKIMKRDDPTGGFANVVLKDVDESVYWDQYKKDTTITRDNPEAVDAYSYLCVGCHGENPGGGGSHPMMWIDGIFPNASKVDRTDYKEPASYTKNLNMNCSSCHFIHTGTNIGGKYILKRAESENTDPMKIRPPVTFKNLCQLCHAEY